MALAKAAEPAYGIAKLIGEGYGKPDGKDETPIDIQYAKLAEWLVSNLHSGMHVQATHVQAAVVTLQRCFLCNAGTCPCRVSGSTYPLTGESACKLYRLRPLQR